MGLGIYYFLLLTLSTFTLAASRGPTVNTTSGVLKGYWPHDSVQAFLGIPYAQPPVGSLRFRAPHAYTRNSSSVIDATEFSYSCFQAPQAILTNGSVPQVVGQSEDCLTLNVWSASESTGQLKPVFIFVYGGGFSEGASSVPLYNGLPLVKEHQDLVVATINYRVNIFGFPNAPGLPEQNLGLRDFRFALEWLHDNIAAFGGDPEHMVAVGESAGSNLLALYPYAHINDPILKGIVCESGTLNNGVFPTNNGTFWRQSVKLTNCSSTSAEQEIECMRAVEPLALLRTVSPFIVNSIDASVITFPIVDNVTVYAEYNSLTRSGRFAQIPVLLGSNKDEMNNLVTSTPKGPVEPNVTALITAQAFTCPASSQAAALSNTTIPIWRYHFVGALPYGEPYPWVGSYHGVEIPFVLGTYKSVQYRDLQPYELAAGRYVQTAWLAFVRDPANGLTNLGWPRYNPNEATLVQLLPNNSATARFVRPDGVDVLCNQPRK